MTTPPRTPPRFVPTLTTVLELPPQPLQEPPAAPDPSPASDAAAVEPMQAIAVGGGEQMSEADAFRLEEQLLHRVLQRVDLSLEERLSDAVSAAVQQQLDSMIPCLRAEVEAVLRDLVSEALARELSDGTGSTPSFGPRTLG